MGRSPHHANQKSTTMSSGPIAIALPTPIPAHVTTPTIPTRSSARRRQSTSVSSTGSSSPRTPAPSTPAAPSPLAAPSPPVAGPSRTPNPLSKSYVAPKNHQTRNHGDKDRAPCPFPEQYGGKVKCGVSDQDEADEYLMATCAALAQTGNLASSPDEIARIIFEENSWVRAPSAAIEPSTLINKAIKEHKRRCDDNKRENLFGKWQLQGAVHEASVLEPALRPGAFEGSSRPKGFVYYLATIASKKWKNPFEGIDMSLLNVKKPNQHRNKSKPSAPAPPPKKAETKVEPPAKASTPTAPSVPKIVLRFSGTGQNKVEADGDDESEVLPGPPRPRAPSRSYSASSRATITLPGLRRSSSKHVRRNDGFLDSDESGSSDSEPEMIVPSRLKSRKPPGLTLNTASPFAHIPPYSPRHLPSYLPSPGLPQSPMFGQPAFSPCPSHSLDNTTWTVRREADLTAQFETSSSSSDEDMRELDWGMESGVMVRDGTMDDSIMWSPGEDETQIKEATDALRDLFPMGSPEDEPLPDLIGDMKSVDMRPTPSDSGSVAESNSTTTAHPLALSKKGIKPRGSAAVPLAAWCGNSSPIASPSVRPAALPIDVSPTQHLSRLRDSPEPNEMDIDVPVWIDESGEGPVRSPDDSFEDHLSSAGESTLEQEKQNDLFAWAAEAAASRDIPVKQEPLEDYPSPLTTDDGSGGYRNGSRASSAAFETHSSGSSELDLPELDAEHLSRFDMQEMLMGPESVTIDELEGWMPVNKEKTPRHRKSRREAALSIGSFDTSCSSIGVGNRQLLAALSGGPKLIRKKSTRTRRQGPLSPASTALENSTHLSTNPSPSHSVDISHDPLMDFDMIGTEELEHARAEAEAKEESSRKLAQKKAERQRACLEACRALRPGTASCDTPSTPWLDHPSPFDFSGTWGHGSTESLHLGTPAPSMLSPNMLQSVAGLSIGDSVGDFGVNPKHLVSPTFHPQMFGPPIPPFPSSDHAMFNLEELVSQAEAQAGILPPPVASAHAAPTPSIPIPVPMSNVTPTVPEPAKSTARAPTAPLQPPSRPVATPPPAEQATSSTASTSPVPPSAPPAKVSFVDKAYVAGDVGMYHGSVTILKQVCEGVLATVVDNIPVYVHVAGPIEGFGKVDVLRRLDTDFVNATTLLIVLGVPESQHDKYIHHPDVDSSRHAVIPKCQQGRPFSPGVMGTWVSLRHAQFIAQQVGDKRAKTAGDGLDNCLRDDLFQVFATMANLNPKHSPGLNFGISSFIPPGPSAPGDKKKVGSGSQTSGTRSPATKDDPPSATSTPGSNTLVASSLNSKSTPNLSALSASAPSQGLPPRKPPVKGPLVRPAPATPLDAAPMPKRRRATIVEGITPKPSPLTIAKKAGSQSPSAVSPLPSTALAPGSSTAPAANMRKVLPKVLAPAPASVSTQTPKPPASSVSATSQAVPVPKRATRASLGNGPAALQAK